MTNALQRRRQASKTVAVVVPAYQEELSRDQGISLKHLGHFLGKYEKYLVMPESLRFKLPGFEIRRFNDRYFTGTEAYSQLMLSSEFYETFIEHEYILIYQFDCLVFSDRLMHWCETGLDYIGAPFPNSVYEPFRGFSRIGNGGFSLRKLSSCLRVINTPGSSLDPIKYWRNFLFDSMPKDIQHFNFPRRLLKGLKILRAARKGARWYMSHYTMWEDRFWSDRASLFYPDFKIPSVETGLRFSFDFFPRQCFHENNNTLPFGCHAWWRYDRGFWEPYLLRPET